MINLNKKEDFGVKNISIFNNGEAGMATGVKIIVKAKTSEDGERYPDWKLLAEDDNGQINEGFYYFDDDKAAGFEKYQAGKLINLVEGILGEDYVLPEFSSAKEALEIVMKLVAKATEGKTYNVLVAYGTNNKPNNFLTFKSFGSFIEPSNVKNSTMALSKSDVITRPSIPENKDEVRSVIEESATGNDEMPDWLKDDQ